MVHIGTQYYRPPFPEPKYWQDDIRAMADAGRRPTVRGVDRSRGVGVGRRETRCAKIDLGLWWTIPAVCEGRGVRIRAHAVRLHLRGRDGISDAV